MSLVAVFALVLAVVITRELARGLAQGRMPRVRAIFDLTKQPVGVTLAGLAATYFAVAALAFTAAATYGLPTGTAHFQVREVIAGGAAVGKLEPGDRIERFDGAPLVVGHGPSLSERVNAKAGAAFDLEIVRDGERRTVHIVPKPGVIKDGKAMWLIGIRPTLSDERARGGATAFALGYPARHVALLGKDIARWFSSDNPDVRSVTRIADEFSPRPTGVAIFEGALRLSGHAFVLFALIDLIRLALAFRDRLRA